MIYSNLVLNITIVKQINYLPVLFQRPCQGDLIGKGILTKTAEGGRSTNYILVDSNP